MLPARIQLGPRPESINAGGSTITASKSFLKTAKTFHTFNGWDFPLTMELRHLPVVGTTVASI